jgi:hypothetical protein
MPPRRRAAQVDQGIHHHSVRQPIADEPRAFQQKL